MITDEQLARKNKRHFWILALLSIPLNMIALAVPSLFIFWGLLFLSQQFDWDVNGYVVYALTYLTVICFSLLIVYIKVKNPIEKILNRNHAYVIKKDSHYQVLIDNVSSLVVALGMEMPELYLIPTDNEDLNHPKANLLVIKHRDRFAIMITDSMLKLFDQYELEALFAVQLELLKSHYVTNHQILHLLYYQVSQILHGLGKFGDFWASLLDFLFNGQLELNLLKANQWALQITYNPDSLISALKKLEKVSLDAPQTKVVYAGNKFYAKSWLVPISINRFSNEHEKNLALAYFKARIALQLDDLKEKSETIKKNH